MFSPLIWFYNSYFRGTRFPIRFAYSFPCSSIHSLASFWASLIWSGFICFSTSSLLLRLYVVKRICAKSWFKLETHLIYSPLINIIQVQVKRPWYWGFVFFSKRGFFFLSDLFWLIFHGFGQSKHQPESRCLRIRGIYGCCNNPRIVRVPAPVPKGSNNSEVWRHSS